MLYFLLINYLIISANSQCDLAKPPTYTPPSTPPSQIYKTPTLNLGSWDVQQPQITSLYLTYEYIDDRVNFTIQGFDNGDSLPPSMRIQQNLILFQKFPNIFILGIRLETQ